MLPIFLSYICYFISSSLVNASVDTTLVQIAEIDIILYLLIRYHHPGKKKCTITNIKRACKRCVPPIRYTVHRSAPNYKKEIIYTYSTYSCTY